jgi:4-hydroxybenzoate polyprenyltransferase
MSILFAYAALTRLYSVIPLSLLAYGVGMMAGASSQPRIAAAAIAIACALAGGYAYNDLRDQPRDRVNRPARPLVSGRISTRQAQWFVVLAFTVSLIAAAATASPLTIAFIAVLIGCLCLYSDLIKRVAGLKNAFVGAWCGVLPWGASIDSVTAAAILPAIVLIGLFVMQKEMVADVYDGDGDAAAGVLTLPVIFGRRAALMIVLALNLLLWLMVRSMAAFAIPLHLAAVAPAVGIVNGIALCAVLLKVTNMTVRAYLELQKIFQIGGCILLFALITAR